MKRAAIDQLPPDLRAWLVRRIKARGFSHYVEITEELRRKLEKRRIPLSTPRSAVQRFGSWLEEQVGRVTDARAVAEALGDDEEGAVLQGVNQLAQAELLRELLEKQGGFDPASLRSVAQTLAQLTGAGLAQQTMRQSARDRAAKKAPKRPGGLSDKTVEMINRRILGIAPDVVWPPQALPPPQAAEDESELPARQDPPQPASARPDPEDSSPSSPAASDDPATSSGWVVVVPIHRKDPIPVGRHRKFGQVF